MRDAKKRCQWTFQEDEQLREAVKKCGPKRWNIVSTLVPTHSGKQCRERWISHLCPEVNKTPFTFEEDTKLVELVQNVGTSWATIKSHFSNRSPCSLKNRYLTLVRHDKAPKPTAWQTEIAISHRNEASLFQASPNNSHQNPAEQQCSSPFYSPLSSGCELSSPQLPNTISNLKEQQPILLRSGTINRISSSPTNEPKDRTTSSSTQHQLTASFSAALDLLQLNRTHSQQQHQRQRQRQQQQQAESATDVFNHGTGRTPHQLLSFLFSSSTSTPLSQLSTPIAPQLIPPRPQTAFSPQQQLQQFRQQIQQQQQQHHQHQQASSNVVTDRPLFAGSTVSVKATVNPAVVAPTNSRTPSPQAPSYNLCMCPTPLSLNPAVATATCPVAPSRLSSDSLTNTTTTNNNNNTASFSGSEKLPSLREMLGAGFV